MRQIIGGPRSEQESTERISPSSFQSDDPALHKAVVRVNVRKHQRQTIQYVAPDDHRALAQAELLVIDEAAAIPLPVVKQLLGPYLVMLSSTVNGYEGTGRSLSLKLIADLKKKSALRKLHELTLTEPIRYGEGKNHSMLSPVLDDVNRIIFSRREQHMTLPTK